MVDKEDVLAEHAGKEMKEFLDAHPALKEFFDAGGDLKAYLTSKGVDAAHMEE